MSALEDRLRDAFRADAQTVRPEAIPDLPARPTRRGPGRARSRLGGLLIPLTAAAAVGAVVAGVSLASPLLRGHQHPHQVVPTAPSASSGAIGPVPWPTVGPAASHGVPASAPSSGVPQFYVTVWIVAPTTTDSLVVRDTATGKVTGRIHPPGSAVFASIAATSGDRTFITAIVPATGCTSELYQFQVNAQGQPGPLVPLHITVPGIISQTGGDLAITPDGRAIAYYAGLCARRSGEQGLGLGLGEVGIIDLATRHGQVWGTSRQPLNQIMGLSLSDDGGLLGYSTFSGTWVLRTSAPGGSLFARSRIVSRSVIWAAVAGDGASLYGCSASPYQSGQPLPAVGTLIYAAISLASGRQRVIASWPGTSYPQCFASLHPAGGHLLVEFPATVSGATDWVRPAILDIRSGRLTDIKAPAFYGPLDVAW